MRNKSVIRRLTALLLCLTVISGAIIPNGVFAVGNESEDGGYTVLEMTEVDPVKEMELKRSTTSEDYGIAPMALETQRVSIVFDDASTIGKGFDAEDIAHNKAAMDYRHSLKKKQDETLAKIEEVLGRPLDVIQSLTLVGNLVSVEVYPDEIELIKSVDGVKDVVEDELLGNIENPDDVPMPMTLSSAAMAGTRTAWEDGYTGAGMKIAVIDSGLDDKHISFDSGAFLYSLEESGFDASNLFGKDDIKAVWDELNASEFMDYDDGLYISEKIPFAFNYADKNLDTDHLHDSQGNHGSHVTGIVAANRYVPDGNGGYEDAEEAVKVVGAAPDAQIFVLKVMGEGGTSSSTLYGAIEDAIILGADSMNLSVGFTGIYFTHHPTYDYVMREVDGSDISTVCAAMNYSYWASETDIGSLYKDDVSLSTMGHPATLEGSLTVASATNLEKLSSGSVIIDGKRYTYSEDGDAEAPLVKTLDGEYDCILIDSVNENISDFDEAKTAFEDDIKELYGELDGKVVLINRGSYDTTDKAGNHVTFSSFASDLAEQGAIAVGYINNKSGTATPSQTELRKPIPLFLLKMIVREKVTGSFEKHVAGNGRVYYTGKIGIDPSKDYIHEYDYPEMSDFSSWGPTGALTLEPDIAAPGESVYSVSGATKDGDSHSSYANNMGTSMASPNVAGLMLLAEQYIRDNGLDDEFGMSSGALARSVLMATAEPLRDSGGKGQYYPVVQQGAGLANIDNAINSKAIVLMDEDANAEADNGGVKAELGDNPSKDGKFSYSFTLSSIDDTDNEYTISTDLFTQDIDDKYLLTNTVPIGATVTYTVNGETFAPTNDKLSADVDMDGDTDGYDAQAILDYLVGEADAAELDLSAGDVDGDGKATSYDAHLILEGLGARITLSAGETSEITVDIDVTENLSEYVNGAYVEGYTFITPVASEDGDFDVTYSIPLLGFYGDWSDPSMFDPSRFTDCFFYLLNEGESDEPVLPYVQNPWDDDDPDFWGHYPYSLNGRIVNLDPIDGDEIELIGNPYFYYPHNPDGSDKRMPGVLEEYSPGVEAVNSETTFVEMDYTLIRSAAQVAFAVTDADTGEFLYFDTFDDYESSAYPGADGITWRNVNTKAYEYNDTFGSLGLEDGDRVRFSIFAIPEYYTPGETFENTEEDIAEFKRLIDVLGDGIRLDSIEFTVDDTAPEIEKAVKDKDGNLIITLSDNNNLALFAAFIADENSEGGFYQFFTRPIVKGSSAEVVIPAEMLVGYGDIWLGAYDYATNSKFVTIEYDSDNAVPGKIGTLYAIENKAVQDGRTDLYRLDPNNLRADGETASGVLLFDSFTNPEPVGRPAVVAAEYSGFVYYIGYDDESETYTGLYAAPIVDLGSSAFLDGVSLVAQLEDFTLKDSRITDIDYNPNDGLLYITSVGGSLPFNLISALDPKTGKLVCDYVINAIYTYNDLSGNEIEKKVIITEIAITADGTFYGVPSPEEFAIGTGPSGEPVYGDSFMFTWKIKGDSISDRIINRPPQITIPEDDGATEIHDLAYDPKGKVIYAAADCPDPEFDNRYLYKFDPEKNSLVRVGNSADEGIIAGFESLFFMTDTPLLDPYTFGGNAATGVEIIDTHGGIIRLIAGGSAKIDAVTTPWYAAGQDIVWTSSNPAVASVDADGVVTAISAGTAEITASLRAKPDATDSIGIIVTQYGSTVSGIIGRDGETVSNMFSLNLETGEYIKGTAIETALDAATDYSADKYIGFSGKKLISIDKATGEAVQIAQNSKKFNSGVISMGYSASGDTLWFVRDSLSSSSTRRRVYLNEGTENFKNYGYMLGGEGEICEGEVSRIYAVGVLDGYWEYMFEDELWSGDCIALALGENNGVPIIIQIYHVPDEGHSALFNVNELNIDKIDLDMPIAPADGNSVYVVSDRECYISVNVGLGIFDAGENRIYHLWLPEGEEVWQSEYIGTGGFGNVPLFITDVESNSPAPASNVIRSLDGFEVGYAEVLDDEEPDYGGGLMSARASSVETKKGISAIDNGAGTVTVTLTAENSTNGLMNVTYDPTVLTLTGVTGYTSYCANNAFKTPGTVSVAYADAGEINGTVAKLTFTYDSLGSTVYTHVKIGVSEDGSNLSAGKLDDYTVELSPSALGHRHKLVQKYNSEYHWSECVECGYVTAKVAHENDGGRCSCGYVFAESGGGQTVEIDVPTEGKRVREE